MNNKYYIPREDEFYSGFEYECCKCLSKSSDGIILDNVFIEYKFEVWDFLNYEDYYLDRCISDRMVRVKYLDSSDIESLGFTRFSYNNESSLYRLGGYTSEVLDMLLNYPDIIDITVNNSNVSKLKITKGVFNINKEVYE